MKQTMTALIVLFSLISLGQTPVTEELWKLYSSRDYTSVLEKTTPLLAADPGHKELNLIVGRTQTDRGNYQEAIPYLNLAVQNDANNSWIKAWALKYLGTCSFMVGKLEDAQKALQECIRINATKNATNDAYGTSLVCGFNDFFKNWQTVETDHFRFHFQHMNEAEIQKYTSLREKAYQDIHGFFKSTLPKKIDFFVWESREDALSVLKTNLGFANPLYCCVHTHYQQTVGHEMTHVISHYTASNSTKTRFINEGTAVCFDRTNRDKLQLVKQWIAANKPVDLKDCWINGTNYTEEILYPLSGLVVKELIDRFGKDKFLEFFPNQTYEHAKSVFGDKLEEVMQELEKKINS